MKTLFFRFALNVAIVALSGDAVSHAATRARFRAETNLNDASVRISAGAAHTCQVNGDGTVGCWGDNSDGQLGTGFLLGDYYPARVSGLTNAVSIAAGLYHNCALVANGTVHCWGSNVGGTLGDGTTTNRSTPVAVNGLSNAVAITAGYDHTCALIADGTARCWGANSYGALGDGTTTSHLTPVTVSGLFNAVAITAGLSHTCALLAAGGVKCWGNNRFGQLGDDTTTNRLTPVTVFVVDPVRQVLSKALAITAGIGHSCALIADGTAQCWGLNDYGQLGDGTTTSRHTAVAVSGLSNAVAITAGSGHSCALLDDSTAKCWGLNREGELGDFTTTTRNTPVAVHGGFGVLLNNAVAISAGRVECYPGQDCSHWATPSFHTCALLVDGSAKCWGDNQQGQLGISPVYPISTAPVVVSGGGGSSITARDVAAGRNHTCALRANSTVACWGSNDSGQIGDGTIGVNRPSPVAVSFLTNAVAIAAGEAHTCALLADGTATCWGANESGQLGDGTTTARLAPARVNGLTNAIAIAAGGTLGTSHTCALLANGTARCWGANNSGQLGTGNTTPSLLPVVVSGLTNAVSIAVGETHTCALLAVGVPFCWGFNGSGRLGDGTQTSHLLPTLVSLENTVSVAGGNTHTCALRADGTAWCWGTNLLGQLGNGSTVSPLVPTLVVNLNLPNAVAIAGGFGHSCEILANGNGLCWGDNSFGQLGNGTTTPSLIPTAASIIRQFGSLLLRSPLSSAVNITTGRNHSCALIAIGGVFCWGDNSFGQIGNGTTNTQLSPLSVPSFTLNINPTVTLEHNGRVSTVTVVATCEAGQQLHVSVTLTQDGVAGQGAGGGACTGGLESYPATVPANGRDPFASGPAKVSAEAVIRDGQEFENQAWARQVNIVSVP